VRHVIWPACILLLLVLGQTSQALEQLPRLNVERSCQEARDSTGADPGQTYKNCLADENDARKALAQKWSSFKAGTRRSCVEAGATPNPSYVELLTCLEMFNGNLMPTDSSARELPPPPPKEGAK
jgi:hypothetical protein